MLLTDLWGTNQLYISLQKVSMRPIRYRIQGKYQQKNEYIDRVLSLKKHQYP